MPSCVRDNTEVVDADLSQYFDTIPHRELMCSVARRISDRQMLRLVKMWLKTPVEQIDNLGNRHLTGGKGSKRGTPQGGVLCPLLVNIYMNRFLKYWRCTRKGEQFRGQVVNFADDFVVLSRGYAREALTRIRWVMGKLSLTLNEAKTRLKAARRENFDFLGPSFLPRRIGQAYLSVSSLTVLPSPLCRRVGIHHITFEACSGFTFVMARRITQPPVAALVTRLRCGQLPDHIARQLPDLPTFIWAELSSAEISRRRGARHNPG